MIKLSVDQYVERFKAFDMLPVTIRNRILDDPLFCNRDFILDCGLQSFAMSVGQVAIDMAPCQSPIEMMMYLSLEKIRYRRDVLGIELQKEVKCNGKKYRADFFIEYGDNLPGQELYRTVIIECDGHDFHEKTKAQAARDKQRDRDMQIAGHSILRFTGSEIYRDSGACVHEIVKFILSDLDR